MQACCLAAAPADAVNTSADHAAHLMWRFLTTHGGGLMPVTLLNAASETSLAQGGIDLQAVCIAGSDIASGELPLQDATGKSVARLVVSISVCEAYRWLLHRFD
jgi:hypothetical protein